MYMCTHICQSQVPNHCYSITLVPKPPELVDLHPSVGYGQYVDDKEHVHLYDILELKLGGGEGREGGRERGRGGEREGGGRGEEGRDGRMEGWREEGREV